MKDTLSNQLKQFLAKYEDFLDPIENLAVKETIEVIQLQEEREQAEVRRTEPPLYEVE